MPRFYRVPLKCLETLEMSAAFKECGEQWTRSVGADHVQPDVPWEKFTIAAEEPKKGFAGVFFWERLR